jgi:uncharacterized protein YbcV (DUF1398 family)
MNQEVVAVAHECAVRSYEGKISFPEVLRKLKDVGVERYHADLCREERVFYMPDGESHVERAGEISGAVAEGFSSAQVEAALRTIQRGEIDYQEFVRRIKAAGCVGYFVLITGWQSLYFGRKGEVYVEKFPALKAN